MWRAERCVQSIRLCDVMYRANPDASWEFFGKDGTWHPYSEDVNHILRMQTTCQIADTHMVLLAHDKMCGLQRNMQTETTRSVRMRASHQSLSAIGPPPPQTSAALPSPTIAAVSHVLKLLNQKTKTAPNTPSTHWHSCTDAPPNLDHTWQRLTPLDDADPPPRLIAIDAEMIEDKNSKSRLPVVIGIAMYDYAVRQTQPLFSDLVDPSMFDARWVSVPTDFDFKETWTGYSQNALINAYKQQRMTPVAHVQQLLARHFHSNTYFVGHGLKGDLEVLRIHGTALVDRVIDTQAIYPLADRRSARLKTLVESILPRDKWSNFQMDGAHHPPYADAEASLDLVLHEVDELTRDPRRSIGRWNAPPVTFVLVPGLTIGSLVGRGGETIRSIREQSRATVIVYNSEDNPGLGNDDKSKRLVGISGEDDAVANALSLIQRHVPSMTVVSAP